ncbi:GIY-YIG nuclease family protein [Echinicola marina]|nr:GIY-YIG nuclease family protein [Echinicola marina]UCS94634.1 GIY-YIG nuclease family protein [Echinicola marina]
MYIVYAISSEIRNYIYVGLTSDLENRLGSSGKVGGKQSILVLICAIY